jgi:hypothetical protein
MPARPGRRAGEQRGTTKFVAAKDLDGLDAAEFHRVYGVNVIGPSRWRGADADAAAPAGLRRSSTSRRSLDDGLRLLARLHGEQGRAQRDDDRHGARLRPAGAGQRGRPGLVETPWLQKGLGAERYAAAVQFYKDRSALDAVMTPEDVAERRGGWAPGRPRHRRSAPARCGLRLTRRGWS